ncbi:hypothetical protein ACU60R_04230 [Klebsiella aerogenes]
MTDINRLITSLKRRTAHAKEFGHDVLFVKLEDIDALVEALEKGQQVANINNWWKPDVCPITGRRFFMWIEHPELGYVPTYGGPFDSYTIPTRDDVSGFSCERYDHDVGGWVDGECAGLYVIDEDEICRVHELEQSVAELREQLRTVELSNSVLESRTVTVRLPADNKAESESPEDDASAWFDEGWNARGKADKDALTAQGIKWEAE